MHIKNVKLMPLLHLPVQSGSNKILDSMNRNHTIEDYLKLIKKLKEKKPNLKFSSDFIIAYPGETDEDFKKTVMLMEKMEFINSYSFIFSPRPGTPAANLEKVDLNIAKNRLKIFQKIANNKKSDYRKNLLDSTIKVLFENKLKIENKYFGRDEHFNSVVVSSNYELTGTIKKVKVVDCNQNTLFGKVVTEKNKGFAA